MMSLLFFRYMLCIKKVDIKYVVCASFSHGNYEGLNKPPVIDLYMGTSYWQEANLTDVGAVIWMDIVFVSLADCLQFCLVHKGSQTSFISGLDLRPLKTTLSHR